MPDTLRLDPADDGYVLRRTTADGQTIEIILSDQDVINLAQTLPPMRDRILSRYSRAGSIEPVVVTPVAQVGLNHEVLGENIVLTLVVPSGAEIAYSIPPHIAEHLVQRIPVHLALVRDRQRTRQ